MDKRSDVKIKLAWEPKTIVWAEISSINLNERNSQIKQTIKLESTGFIATNKGLILKESWKSLHKTIDAVKFEWRVCQIDEWRYGWQS